jgi:hypothetical protein
VLLYATLKFEYLAEGAPWTVEPTLGGQNAVMIAVTRNLILGSPDLTFQIPQFRQNMRLPSQQTRWAFKLGSKSFVCALFWGDLAVSI